MTIHGNGEWEWEWEWEIERKEKKNGPPTGTAMARGFATKRRNSRYLALNRTGAISDVEAQPQSVEVKRCDNPSKKIDYVFGGMKTDSIKTCLFFFVYRNVCC